MDKGKQRHNCYKMEKKSPLVKKKAIRIKSKQLVKDAIEANKKLKQQEEREFEELLMELKRGTTFLQFWSGVSTPQYRRFSLSDNELFLMWKGEGKVSAGKSKVAISDLESIVMGQKGEGFKDKVGYGDKEPLSFSLIYRDTNGRNSLDLCAGSVRDLRIYTKGINYLLKRQKEIGERIKIKKTSRPATFTGLTKEQIYEIKMGFSKFNLNRTDELEISSRDLRRVLNSFGVDPGKNDILAYIQLYDAKGLGYIGFDSFLKIMEDYLAPALSDEEVLKAFKTLDVWGNGLIQKRKLKEILLQLAPTADSDEINEMVDEVPHCKSQISYAQFVHMYSVKQ